MTDGTAIDPPLGLLAELTHRCPLSCPYCSNPENLDRRSGELDTETWKRVFAEAAALGVMQVHLSGGEPTARADIVEITAHCRDVGLYTNLITSGINVAGAKLDALDAGLDHVQIVPGRYFGPRRSCLGDAGITRAEAGTGRAGDRRLGLPLTVNAVIHRGNADRVREMVQFAVDLGARRIEIAHVQYYGWALRNRDALMPTAEQVRTSTAAVDQARADFAGQIVIDAVVPDYYARRPKPCVGGWGRRSLNVTPAGKVLPCHAAETIPAPDVSQCARPVPVRHLAPQRGLQCLSRHRLDGRTLPQLRPAGRRFRRLSLPGAGHDRRCRGDRSRLPAVPVSCPHDRTGGDGGSRSRGIPMDTRYDYRRFL